MYVKITNGAVEQYPYTLGNLRRDNPNTSFPKSISEQTLNEWGVYKVSYADAPSFNERTEELSADSTPSLVDGVWTISYTVVSKSAEVIAEELASQEEDMRGQRDTYLQTTDWWALSDTPDMTAEQAAYREALRNITTHANWPWLEESDWPTMPV